MASSGKPSVVSAVTAASIIGGGPHIYAWVWAASAAGMNSCSVPVKKPRRPVTAVGGFVAEHGDEGEFVLPGGFDFLDLAERVEVRLGARTEQQDAAAAQAVFAGVLQQA